MASKHPSDDILERYATGSLSEGLDIFVKGHLHFCPTCRNKVEMVEIIAGELLSEASDETQLESITFNSVLAKVKDYEINGSESPVQNIIGGAMPKLINNFVGKTSDEINWRFRLPGISDYQISNHDGEEISLLKADPGTKIFQHTHDGDEATLVLSGALQDGEDIFNPGDVSMVNENHTHNPSIIGNEPCICLIIMSGKVRFTGRFTRAFNFLT